MRLPWSKPRRRAAVTDALVNQIQAAATGGGNAASVSESAGAQIAATIYSGALGGASIQSSADFAPDFLSSLAIDLILRGESLYAIEADRSLVPVASWDITGSAAPATWTFRCSIDSPNGTRTRMIPRAGVCFFTWRTNTRKPWRGISPISAAKGMATLAAKSAQGLANEFNASHLYVVPFMQETRRPENDGDINLDSEFEGIKKTATGQTSVLTFTNQHAWKDDQRDKTFEQKRLGAVLEQNSVIAAFKSQVEVCQLCGIPASLVTDAGSPRDGFRFWISTQLEPLAKRISAELTRYLETEVTIDLSPISRQDIVGRSRAFGSLVKGGMDISEAAKISGVLSEEDTD